LPFLGQKIIFWVWHVFSGTMAKEDQLFFLKKLKI